MSRDSMKISARAVQELLAGTLSEEEFLKQHQMVPTEDHKWSWNPFAEALKTGRLIDRVTIEKCPDSDDDWLIFHFSGEDQAIAKFKVP